jgi:hypothetical protein
MASGSAPTAERATESARGIRTSESGCRLGGRRFRHMQLQRAYPVILLPLHSSVSFAVLVARRDAQD